MQTFRVTLYTNIYEDLLYLMTHTSTSSNFNSNNKKQSEQKHTFSRGHGILEKPRDSSLNLNFKRTFNSNCQIKLFNYKRYEI